MTLIEAVQQIDKLDGDSTIYAREPWSPSAEAKIAVQGSEDEKKIRSEGFSYFLEIFIARDFIEDWKKTQKDPALELCCVRLIKYAVNDA